MIQSVQTDISEIGRNLKISTTILDKTLETIPANITKLLNIDKTNFVSPSLQFNVMNNAETTFGNRLYHDTSSTLNWGSGGLRMAT
jgi:hypothetical protein